MRRDPNRRPTHPGAILREDVLPDLGLSKDRAANLLGVSLELLDGVLAEEQPISAAMAASVGKLFGGGPDIWMRMQAAHDEV